MDQASASPAASCVGNPAAPRTSSSCSRSAGRSRTAAPPPARSDPQCEPHAEPSNNRPRSSSPALCRLKAKRLSAAGFLLRRDRKPGRFSEGLLLRRLQEIVAPLQRHGDWVSLAAAGGPAMKLPRRKFLHLAAGAAALH